MIPKIGQVSATLSLKLTQRKNNKTVCYHGTVNTTFSSITQWTIDLCVKVLSSEKKLEIVVIKECDVVLRCRCKDGRFIKQKKYTEEEKVLCKTLIPLILSGVAQFRLLESSPCWASINAFLDSSGDKEIANQICITGNHVWENQDDREYAEFRSAVGPTLGI